MHDFRKMQGRGATIYATKVLPGCSINIQAKSAVENSLRYFGYNLKNCEIIMIY